MDYGATGTVIDDARTAPQTDIFAPLPSPLINPPAPFAHLQHEALQALRKFTGTATAEAARDRAVKLLSNADPHHPLPLVVEAITLNPHFFRVALHPAGARHNYPRAAVAARDAMLEDTWRRANNAMGLGTVNLQSATPVGVRVLMPGTRHAHVVLSYLGTVPAVQDDTPACHWARPIDLPTMLRHKELETTVTQLVMM